MKERHTTQITKYPIQTYIRSVEERGLIIKMKYLNFRGGEKRERKGGKGKEKKGKERKEKQKEAKGSKGKEREEIGSNGKKRKGEA